MQQEAEGEREVRAAEWKWLEDILTGEVPEDVDEDRVCDEMMRSQVVDMKMAGEKLEAQILVKSLGGRKVVGVEEG